VRETAAWALGQIEDGAAVAALGEAAGGDADEEVRGTAAWAIGQIQPGEAPAGLIRAVRDADAEVRARAAWALSEMRDTRAISALREAYRTERDSKARRAQLRALVRGGGASEELFRELLRSDDAEVREQAVRGMAGRSMDPWPWPMPRPRPYP
jgi:HEAT repeat protein